MAFEESTAPDITEGMPAALGSSLLASYPADDRWDVSFGELGFRLCTTEGALYQRATEQARKQQIDMSEDAGEQSLSSWWYRTQSSWDRGGGIRWFDPGSVPSTRDRFAESLGVDVWTQGEVRLLRALVPDSGGTRLSDTFVSAFEWGGTAGFVEAWASSVRWVPETGTPTASSLPGAGATQPAAAGDALFIGHIGGVSRYVPGAVSTPLTCSGTARAWWVKSRLFVGVGPSLYEVPVSATGDVAAVATKAYTHPSAAWVWSDVTETAGAILAAGYANAYSGIFRFTVENDENGVPELRGPSQVAQLPNGERVTCMGVYLGSTVVLGTNRGVRVGEVSDTGDVRYGPLSVLSSNNVADVTFRDRFAYLSVTGSLPGDRSGVVRVDLSTRVEEDGPYAWAWDVHTDDSGEATSVALVGDRVVLASGRRVYRQGDGLVEEGWLDTGRIRFATSEPKAFRLLRSVVETNGGEVGLSVVTPDGAEHLVVNFTDLYRTEDDIPVVTVGRPVNQFLSVRVVMRSKGSGSPVLSALSLKAVPAGSRVKLVQFPVSLYDFEELRYGDRRGVTGGAYARLRALEALEATGYPVQVVDYRTGESFSGQVDSVDFSAKTPPHGASANFEGTAVVVVRQL